MVHEGERLLRSLNLSREGEKAWYNGHALGAYCPPVVVLSSERQASSNVKFDKSLIPPSHLLVSSFSLR